MPVTTNKPQLAHQASLNVNRRYTPFEIKYLFKMSHFSMWEGNITHLASSV
jgi:hypothetical protein